LIVFPVFDSAHDARFLGTFISAVQQQHDCFAIAGVIHAIAGAKILAQFSNPFTTRLTVTKVSCRNFGQTKNDSRLGLLILEGSEPCLEGYMTRFVAVMF
jgi:hypothetical protein